MKQLNLFEIVADGWWDRFVYRSMSKESEELRDVANQIELLARAHPSWSMTYKIINNTVDHLVSIAVQIELRDRLRAAAYDRLEG